MSNHVWSMILANHACDVCKDVLAFTASLQTAQADKHDVCDGAIDYGTHAIDCTLSAMIWHYFAFPHPGGALRGSRPVEGVAAYGYFM